MVVMVVMAVTAATTPDPTNITANCTTMSSQMPRTATLCCLSPHHNALTMVGEGDEGGGE
jgi:hypothetical protein